MGEGQNGPLKEPEVESAFSGRSDSTSGVKEMPGGGTALGGGEGNWGGHYECQGKANVGNIKSCL